MVDPYAIVRRLTGHELISPKDARLLTEAVDGLIDEIGSKDTRIAELEAEVERQASDIAEFMRRLEAAPSPSPAPGVVEALTAAKDFIALEYADARQEQYGEWLAPEARKVFGIICEALASERTAHAETNKLLAGVRDDAMRADNELCAMEARIAELAAENERLKIEIGECKLVIEQQDRDAEALSRTGAAKVRELLHEIGTKSLALRKGGPDPMDLHGLSDALEEAIDLAVEADSILSALEPAARNTNPVASHETGNMRDKRTCATEGCDNPATNEFIRGDVGSFYCGDCFGKVIEVCEARPAPEGQQPVANEPATNHWPEAHEVADILAENKGFWRACSGCHETNEGHPTGPWSTILGCNLGHGCHECGGIGAVWDTTDYADMGDCLAQEFTRPSEQAVTDAMVEAAAVSLRPELFAPLDADQLRSDDYAWTRREDAKANVLHKVRAALKAAMEAGLEEMTRSCLAERAGRLAAEAERDRLREALTKLCDWVEHEVGAELPFDARAALKAAMEAGR